MEFIRFCFSSPWHYFGILFAIIIILSLLVDVVKAVSTSHSYTPINYYLPNVKTLINDIAKTAESKNEEEKKEDENEKD